MSTLVSRKRSLPSSPLSERQPKDRRRSRDHKSPHNTVPQRDSSGGSGARDHEEKFAREQTRLNQIQEAEQMRQWVAKEDDFVLKQSKKKAHIRVKEGRARSIDCLAVTLAVIDRTRDPLEDEHDEADMNVIDPSGVFEGLDFKQLQELGKDIDTYLSLETNYNNRKYWNALKIICQDYQSRSLPTSAMGRSNTSVSLDIDRLLSPKTLTQLTVLDKQISDKLQSNEPIDVEYWEHLLRSVAVYKAKAELNAVYKSIIEHRLTVLRQEQRVEAINLARKLELILKNPSESTQGHIERPEIQSKYCPESVGNLEHSRDIDPEPLLKLRTEDKNLDVIEETDFLENIVRPIAR